MLWSLDVHPAPKGREGDESLLSYPADFFIQVAERWFTVERLKGNFVNNLGGRPSHLV
ncbi:MAG: hypothetical protein K0Q55_639 [Verrucomicrobia bacterium]|jgi:hypothetical protein|nr:hypothetical protein [Verrucomicrobiota bacterium]